MGSWIRHEWKIYLFDDLFFAVFHDFSFPSISFSIIPRAGAAKISSSALHLNHSITFAVLEHAGGIHYRRAELYAPQCARELFWRSVRFCRHLILQPIKKI